MKSSFFKNILTLITGNVIAFIIPVAIYPLLSRIFTPNDYALFGLYFGIFSFLEIASAGRYDFAIVLPEKDIDAINLVAGGLIIAFFFSILILILVLFLNDILAVQLNNPNLVVWLFALPLGLFLISVSKLFNSWLIRVKKFKAASINKASQKVGEGFAQLGFGFFKTGSGLILGDLGGRLLNAVFSLYQSIKTGFDKSKISKALVKKNVIQYIEFPKFGILPSMLNTLGGMMPVFMISSVYSIEISGNFNFSRIILSVPFALIATGISQVLMQQVAEQRQKKEPISKELYSLAVKLSILSCLTVIPLYFVAPDLFSFIFGEKWRLSGEFTSILIFATAISFVVSPFSMLLVVLGKIRLLSFWQVFYFCAVSVLWFFKTLTIDHFLWLLVIVDVTAYSLYGMLIHRTVRNYERDIASQF